MSKEPDQAMDMASEHSLHKAYLALAQEWSLWEEPLQTAVAHITEFVSRTLHARRVGVWLLNATGSALELVDLYDDKNAGHQRDWIVARAECPVYFGAVEAGRVVAASDAHTDYRTREFSDNYLTLHGVGAMLDATLRKAGKFSGVLCVEHVGGQRLWNEQEKRYVVSIADLVMQRLVYEDTRRSEAYYRELSALQQAVFDSAHYSIISTDVNGVIVSFNKAAARMLGYAEDELIGRHTLELLHDPVEIRHRAAALSAELHRAVVPGIEAVVSSARRGVAEEREWTWVRRDGGRFPVLLSVTPLRGDDGQITGFLGIASDITERQLAKRALQEEEVRYRALFERAGDSTFLMKEDRFIDCNKATLRVFGCTREQILNETPYRYSPEYQPDGRPSREKALEKITDAFKGRTQFFEWRHVRHNGTPFDSEVTLNVIEIDGEPHLLATVRDISSRKRAELELAASRQALLERNESLRLVNELSSRLHGSASVSSIVDETMSTLLGMSHKPHVAIYMTGDQGQRLQLAASHGFSSATVSEEESLPLSESLGGCALSQGSLFASPDLASDNRIAECIVSRFVGEGFRSAVVIPLIYNDNPLGSINLLYPDHSDFSTIEIETLQAIGKTVSLSLANAQHMAEMEYLAHHDSLTRLPNRAILHQEFARRTAPRRGCAAGAALMLLDLDRFKEVNDTLGHYVGDALLKQIGPRLSSALAGGDRLLCRLGGDEFTILAGGVAGHDQLAAFARQVLAALRQPFRIDDMVLELDASIGIAIYPEHGDDSHALLRSADVAMYEAKRKGSGYAFYDRLLDQHSPQRLAIMSELGTAVRKHQLCLHFQPKVALAGAAVSGFEALVRWQHPVQGLLYPDKFVPTAEVSDVIHQLSQRVLDLALQQQKCWADQGYDLPVAVNLSARNLVDERCYHAIRELLDAHGVAADRLELEITETALMHDPEGAVKLLGRITEMGVKLSIDDFGTGYSSLAYLRRLPIDALKIDRVFVRDMLQNEQDVIIVRSIIALAHNLNLLVVAEGVEDADTLRNLHEMNCDMAQGYHIARPAPPDDITQWLAAGEFWR